MSIKPLVVSIMQAPLVWGDKTANLNYFKKEFAKISTPVDLIVLPEMFATGFVTDHEEISEPMGGEVMQWMKACASELKCVITGSIAIKEDSLLLNRLIWIRPDGSFEKYDKRHLFRMGNEHLKYSQGNESLIVELNGWKIKPLVCYDLRFPVWSKNRLIDDTYEYDLLIFVANWPASRYFAWQTLLAARAIENQAFCIGVNRIGEDGKGIPHRGGSVILDFKGKLLTGCEDNKPGIATLKLDYETLDHFRNQFRVALDWDKFEITE